MLYLYAVCYILYSRIFYIYIYVLCQGISCLICNPHHTLPTVFLQGSQRASSQKVTSVLGHVSLLECVPPLILHISYTDTQIFSFFASCLPETKKQEEYNHNKKIYYPHHYKSLICFCLTLTTAAVYGVFIMIGFSFPSHQH